MLFSYVDHNRRKILCDYWNKYLTLEILEKYKNKCDEIQIWYPHELDERIYDKYGSLISYIELNGSWQRLAYSRIIDLHNDVDYIYEHFSKNTRYEIRRARNRDNIMVRSWRGHEISETLLSKYFHFYDEFALTKSLPKICREKMKALVSSNQYMISVAEYKGHWIAVHGIIVSNNDKTAALCTSSSLFREDNGVNSALIGRANRYLHLYDFVEAKKLGYIRFDMGGIYKPGEDENIPIDYKNVADFKGLFGGEVVEFRGGFILQWYILDYIDAFINKNGNMLKDKKVVVYGYGHCGKYFVNKLYAEVGVRPFIIIDNRLFEHDDAIVSEEEFSHYDEYNRKDSVLIMCINKGKCTDIIRHKCITAYSKSNRIYYIDN